MKKKADFVTNSSTCSFLVVGWEIHKDRLPEDLKDEDGYPDWEKYRDLDIEVLMGREMGASSDDHMIVGDQWTTDEYETTKISIKDILRIQKDSKVKKLFDLPDDLEPSVFIGVRMC